GGRGAPGGRPGGGGGRAAPPPAAGGVTTAACGRRGGGARKSVGGGLRRSPQPRPAVKTRHTTTRATSQPSASRGRPSRSSSAAMPSAVNRLCDAISAVFEITTEANASAPLTCQGRSRYAFTGSPTAAAAGGGRVPTHPA